MRKVNELPDTELLSFTETAELLGLTRGRISQMVRDAQLSTITIGPHRMVLKKQALTYEKEKKKAGWPLGKSRKIRHLANNNKK